MQIIALDSEKNQQSFTAPQFELGLEDTRSILQKVFVNRLPKKVLATNDPLNGTFEYPKWKAIEKRLIQFNHYNLATKLVLDVDSNIRHLEQEGFSSIMLPEPSWVAYNNQLGPRYGRAHVCYELIHGVSLTEMSSIKAIKLFRDIQNGFYQRFTEAGFPRDDGYNDVMCKNPLKASDYHVNVSPRVYSLADLAEWIPKKTVVQRESRIGRNCDVFDSLRFWAYKNFRNFGTKEQFITGTRQVAENLNRTFVWADGPLTAAEIKIIAKSVATWTWEHRVEGRSDRRGRSFADYVEKTHTPEIQRLRGLKSGAVRFEKAMVGRDAAMKLKAQGRSLRAIGKELGVSHMTVKNWLSGFGV